jgi:disulfide bond formation protein DsbB
VPVERQNRLSYGRTNFKQFTSCSSRLRLLEFNAAIGLVFYFICFFILFLFIYFFA